MQMKVAKNSVVAISYRLTDSEGELVENTDEPLEYLHGGYGGMFPRIEEVLEGKEAGFQATLHLEPDDAFGEYDAQQVRVEPRAKFPEPLEIGMRFEGVPEDEDEDTEILTVTDITDDTVVLDANHPLAGIALEFAVEVVDIRPATEEEIEHEHVHGGGSHMEGEDHAHYHELDVENLPRAIRRCESLQMHERRAPRVFRGRPR
jgi:FKBP-type peptidyl-prolyl cis-trans isomerase SlyD